MIQHLNKPYRVPLLAVVISLFFYWTFAYQLDRADFPKLIGLFIGLFLFAYTLLTYNHAKIWVLVGAGVLFRVILFPAIPNLSQDFYRFLWDGRLLIQGINPYLITPETYLSAGHEVVPQAQELYQGMGSLNASHYSNYPPVNQLCFAIAALFAKNSILGSVLVLKTIVIAADLGVLYFGKKLLDKLKLPVNNIFWYFLNPFIIIELTGNLHFEGVMLFFVVWALYLLYNKQWFWAAVLLGISISVKLLPLLLLPIFVGYFIRLRKNAATISQQETNLTLDTSHRIASLGITKLILFYGVVLATVIITFVPFLSSEFVSNFSATIALWFQNFEFNASVYYIIRWIGFQTVGWNIIETVGKVLPLIVIAGVLMLAFFRSNKTPQQLITGLLFGASVYFLLATTVHPWYVATPLLLSVCTRYRFPVVWSFMVLLSYSAYGADGFKENLWLVALEYSVVVGYAIYEIFIKKTHVAEAAA